MAEFRLHHISKALQSRIKQRSASEGKWPRTWVLEVINQALKQPAGEPLRNPEVKIPQKKTSAVVNEGAA
jgi:hypothetical protein